MVPARGGAAPATRDRILLPAGFIAGILTNDVNPNDLFGATFQPLVSLGVGLILFEAGLRLRLTSFREGCGEHRDPSDHGGCAPHARGDHGRDQARLRPRLGRVPGPRSDPCHLPVPRSSLPLLAFVRPTQPVRSVLEVGRRGLIDPIGALLGVVAFTAVKNGVGGGSPFHPGGLFLSPSSWAWRWAPSPPLCSGSFCAGAADGSEQAVPAALMCVAAALVGADLIKEDAGFVATATMGIVMANQHRLDVSRVLEFHGTVVSLLIGMLFILISASVTPSQVNAVLWESLALIAVMVIVLRPLDVAVATWRSQLSMRERAFITWMAPRGIVAAATASAFGLELTQAGVSGADKILPISFVVIFGTVILYGLTSLPVARLLGIAGAAAPVVLLVGGHPMGARDRRPSRQPASACASGPVRPRSSRLRAGRGSTRGVRGSAWISSPARPSWRR